MKIVQTNLFSKQLKKLPKTQKVVLDSTIKKIISNPEIGKRKKADLQDVRVIKYKIKSQQYLLAYLYEKEKIILLAHGVYMI